MRLNCGSGNVPLGGWVNIDKYYYPGSKWPLTDQRVVERWVDAGDSKWIYGDVVDLQFPSEAFDTVMLVHVLEHLSMEEGNLAIQQAYQVLKFGGTIEVEVPDLEVACRALPNLETNSPEWCRIMGCIYGTTGKDGEGQFHLCGYTQDYLRFKLLERGFKDVEFIHVGFGHGNDQEGHAEPQLDFRLRATK